MQIGFNMLLWTPFVTEEHFPLFAPLKEIGYDGVELEIFEGTPDHYARVARELDNHGLRRTGVTIIPDQERNILSADPARRSAPRSCAAPSISPSASSPVPDRRRRNSSAPPMPIARPPNTAPRLAFRSPWRRSTASSATS